MTLYLSHAFKSLRRRRLRTFLTVLSITIGVSSVVIISSVGQMGKAFLNDELQNLGISGIALSANRGLDNGTLSASDLEAVMAMGVTEAATPLIIEYSKLRYRTQIEETVLWGIDSNAGEMANLDVVYGRLLNRYDVLGATETCLISEKVAEKIYSRANIVGKKIAVYVGGGFIDVEVVGVLKSASGMLSGAIAELVPNFIYIPITTLQRMSGANGYTQIVVKIKPDCDVEASGLALATAVAGNGRAGRTITYDNLSQQVDTLNNILGIVTSVLSVIAAISLVVAGLGIMTVMLVSVGERTREVGIKKSIGATRWMIVMEFLAEAAVMSVTGSAIGAAVGVAVSIAGCLYLGIGIALDPGTIINCLILSTAAGLVFGVYPALKAAAMNPVDALRYL